MPSTQSQYKLVRVTDRQLADYTREQNSQSWKGILSAKDYILREYVLSRCEMTKDLSIYMLQDTENPDEKLCSIELLVRDSTKYYKDGDVVKKKAIKSGCIGGVFTYPEHRGQGLGKIMIDQLVQLGKNELIGEDGYIFLYSEVGEYYTRNGFKSIAVDVLEMPMRSESKYFSLGSLALVQVPEGVLEPVGYHEFSPLMDLYQHQSEQEIISLVKTDSKPRVSLDISSQIIDWFHLRAKYISYKLFELPKDAKEIDFNNDSYSELVDKLKPFGPQVYGFKLTNGTDILGHIAWTYDWKSPQKGYATVLAIYVNKFIVKDVILMKLKLIEYVKDYLNLLSCEYEKVVVWTLELPGVDFESLGVLKDNPSRSAIQMYDEQEQKMVVEGDLIWENNNKLPWF